MKIYVIQAEWSSGIPDQPLLFADELSAQATWDSLIDQWIEYRASRYSPSEGRDAVTKRLYERNEEGFGWGAGVVELSDDSTMRSWDVALDVSGESSSGESRTSHDSVDRYRPCGCVVDDGEAMCLCALLTGRTTGICARCAGGSHTFTRA